MAKIQCKMCGGLNDLPDGVTSGACQYCGSLTTFPKIDDDYTERLYSRAETFRQRNDFDKAVSSYESILETNSEDPEAYWGLLISRYGIEYVEDPATHERIPTCHRVQYESILADPDYQNALKYASAAERDIYEKEAQRISEIQKDILRISAQEKPYDVFICYKESTDGGTRTKDSTFAQEIYYQLANQGLKVFFSRITLEDKLGQQYEPYIFAALNSAKVMLVIGSKKEYFEAVWVKNEWSRFLALKKKDRSRLIIPCYKDMDPYDIPEELSIFQCQDMGKIGFIQDIIRGIMKVVNAGKPESKPAASAAPVQSGPDISKVMKRIAILMRQNEWEEAKIYCKDALKNEPENAELYLMLCMINHKIPTEDELRRLSCDLSQDKNFQVAMQLASPERKKQLESTQKEAVGNLADYYLKQLMSSCQVTQLSDLAHSVYPFSIDSSFIQAMKFASPELKEELQRLKKEQPEYFLRKCMENNHVSSEEELTHCSSPLISDRNFQLALQLASPERARALQRIQNEQPEYFLRKCMENNHVSSLMELSRISTKLESVPEFNLAKKHSAPALKEELEQLQRAQKAYWEEMMKRRVLIGFGILVLLCIIYAIVATHGN